MAVTGWKSPGTVGNDATVGNKNWKQTNNAKTQNDSYSGCTGTTGDTSEYLKATNFGFTDGDIPAGENIRGIEVGIDGVDNVAGATITISKSRIVKGGTIQGTDVIDTGGFPTLDQDNYQVQGGPTQKWGTTWLDSDIKASNFGYVIQIQPEASGNWDGDIDHIRIRVHYGPRRIFNIT